MHCFDPLYVAFPKKLTLLRVTASVVYEVDWQLVPTHPVFSLDFQLKPGGLNGG